MTRRRQQRALLKPGPDLKITAPDQDACPNQCAYLLHSSLLLMAMVFLSQFPWEVQGSIIEFIWGCRCWLCEERKGLLCRIDHRDYEMRCVDCYVGMLPDDTHPRFVDGIQNGVHSHSACSASIAASSSQ